MNLDRDLEILAQECARSCDPPTIERATAL
jgi:hypothetical protein